MADNEIHAIARRVVTNAQWASVYLGYFESSNDALRNKRGRLKCDAEEMLVVLVTGLPRVCSLCLVRLWDLPGSRGDRHSLPALVKIEKFAQLSDQSDRSFLRDCQSFLDSRLCQDLKQFRIVDLAHNLPLGRAEGEGFTYDRLREAVHETQRIVDRLVHILNLSEVNQEAIFQSKKESCDAFWNSVEMRIVETAA
jgi:hypothetical protein